MHDLDAIRDKVSLVELFRRDGHEIKKKGARWFCRCPFHEEKSGSCLVDDGKGTFKCFGCGAGGDLFKYWQLSRGVEFVEAAAELAQIAGTGVLPDGAAMPKRAPAKVEETVPLPLDGKELERWNEGVTYLERAEGRQRELSEWRGYTTGTVETLVKRRLVAMPMAFGERRWAFPIEAIRPTDAGVERFVAGYHVRLPDRQNAGKWYFNYVPSSDQCEGRGRPTVGAWPYVLGDPATCKAVVIIEGQWDMIAAADALGMVESDEVAFIGVRGSSTWRRVLPWTWPEEAQAFLFLDNDEAGMGWLEGRDDEPSFAAILRHRSRALHAFVFEGVKDFNDAHRGEGTTSREAWRAFFRERYVRGLRTRRKRR